MSNQTFLFADLSGFTALTEAHGDEQAVRDLLPVYGGEEIKTIGDAVMVRVTEAAAAIRLGLEIVQALHAKPRFPVVHVGMHTGPAVKRGSDWFGASVNPAARVAGAAGGGHVLLTKATSDASGQVDGVKLESLGETRLRNVSNPVHLSRALLSGTRVGAFPIDPVCRMTIVPGDRAGRLAHGGHEYSFCSLACAGAFATDPDRYSGQASPVRSDELSTRIELSQGPGRDLERIGSRAEWMS